MEDSGAPLSGTGSHASTEPASVLGPAGFDPSRSRQVHGDERLARGARFVRDHDTLAERLFPKWAERRRRRRAFRRYGWDFMCSGCERWVHAEQCGQSVAETTWHWHYLCTCGMVNHIFLGHIIAVRDDGKWGGAEAYESGPYLAGGKA